MDVAPDAPVAFDDSDSALVKFYHEKIQQSLVYIEHKSFTKNVIVSGTGTVIAYQGNVNDGWLPLILTAGHVIRGTPGEQSEFRLTRYSWDDPFNPVSRCAVFRTGGMDARSPGVNYYNGPESDIIDIGFIRGPLCCEDGKPFFHLDDRKIPVATETVPIETGCSWAAEGTRVAWAGYPEIARRIAQRPQPCYFEGCVSSLILRRDSPLYLLDGHNTFGVSGGPVWAIGNERNEPRVFAAISSYRFDGQNPEMPGFAHAVPIQPLWEHLQKNWGAKSQLVR